MANPWDEAPIVGRETAATAPAQEPLTPSNLAPWDAAPVLSGPSARQRAVIQAQDNPEEAGRAYNIGRKLGVPPTIIQPNIPEWDNSMKRNAAAAASANPTLAKWINENPMAASVGSDDWDAMQAGAGTFERLGQAVVNGVASLKALSKTPIVPGEMDFGPLQAFLNEKAEDPNHLVPKDYLRGVLKFPPYFVESMLNLPRRFAEASEQYTQTGEYDPGPSLEAAMLTLGGGRQFMRSAAGRGPPGPTSEYMTVDEFLHKVQGLTDREAIDAFLRSKEQKQGPLLMITKAEHAKEVLDKAVEVAQTSKVKEKTPDLYANMGAAAGDEVVHIPADKILELYKRANKVPAEGDGLFGFVPDLAKQLETASKTGGEITIPASQYVAHVDETIHAALSEDVRLHDDGVTVTEAKEAEEQFKAAKEAAAPEKIAGAAVLTDKGQIVQGILHSDALEAAGNPENYTAGFVTNTGRFVDRQEALDIAARQEQLQMPVTETPLTKAEVQKFGEEGLHTDFLGKTEDIDYKKVDQGVKARNAGDLAPSAETTKGKPGANTGRLARLLGPKLYGEPSNMTHVSVKEMVQNAFDAIKGMLEKGQLGEGGKIDINLDRQNRTITVYDNGSGMKPETLGKQFLEIAGTLKESEAASGGLGIAKMLFLFGNKELEVTTLRDGKVSVMRTTGDNLFKAMEGDESLAPDIETRVMSRDDRKLFPDGHGTIVKVTVPESYKDASTGEDKKIPFDTWIGSHPVLQNSPLFNNIEVTKNGEVLPIGKNFPIQDFTQFANVNFEWGTARIYVTKEPHPEKWGENLHVLSNGLWQFSLELKKDPRGGWGPNIQHDFYIDVSPKVSPDQPGYPFELSRQGFSPATRKEFGKIFQYIQRAYQQLDFATSAKNFGDIQYLDKGEFGEGVIASEKQPLQPDGATQIVDEAGLKEGDKVEVVDGKLIVNNREIPELNPEDLKKNHLDIEKMSISQDLIDPNRVMLHDNIEVRVKGDETSFDPYEQIPYEDSDLAGRPKRYRGEIEGTPLSDNWVSLVDAARERYPERFDEFMFRIGDMFIQLRNEVATALGYDELLKEGVGISFDPEYRGVSIRLPFSASFINPAVPVFIDPIRAAVGVVGTMIHEFAHHRVRGHDADFPAEMQKIQIFLDTNEILQAANREGGEGFNLSKFKEEMVRLYEDNHDIFLWLNEQITEGTAETVRSRGKRFKDSGEVTERDGGTAPDLGAGGDGGLGPSYQSIKGSEGDATTPTDAATPSAIAGAVEATVNAEKKQLYLSPMFKDAKAVGLTATEFRQYSKKLEKAENDILDRAIRLHRNQIKKALTSEYKRDEAQARQEAEASLKESGPFAAEKFLRENKIDLKPENAQEFAAIFGYDNGGDLLANLSSIKAQERAGVPLKKQFDQTVDGMVEQTMKAKHGDLAQKIADEAREMATDGHTFDILDFEVRTLANAGKLLPPIEKAAFIATAKASFEDSLLTDGANYTKLRRAVEAEGRKAEKALLKGDFQEAFHAKQRQFTAAVHMRESARLQRTIDSVEKKIDKFSSKAVVPSVDQAHTEQMRNLLGRIGIEQSIDPVTAGGKEPLAQFVADSEGQIQIAPWILDDQPPQIGNMTVANFRDLQLSMRSLEHVGAQAKQLSSAQGKAEIDNAVFDMVKENDRFVTNFKSENFVVDKIRSGYRSLIGSHLLVERMLDYMDQFNPNGPVTKWLDRPLRDANVKELQLQERVSRELRSLAKFTDTTINEQVENNLFPDARSRSRFLKMNRQNARVVALYMGTRTGIQKLTEGFGIDEKDVRRWLNKTMRDQDWEWVQGIWNINKWLKVEGDEMAIRDTGLAPPTLEPVPIEGRTGGYAPIIYGRGSGIEEHMAAKNPIFAPTYYSAATPQKWTRERTGYAAPLDLNGTYLPSRMQAMVHDIAFREAIRQASRIINHPAFAASMELKWSPEYKELLHGWLKDIANTHLIDDAYAQGWARGIAILRHNVTSSLIAANPGTFIKHGFTAMGMSIERVGAGKLGAAAFEIGPSGWIKSVPDLLKPNDIVPNDAFMQAYRDVIEQGERGDNAREFILQSSAVMRNRQRQYVDSIRGAFEASSKAGIIKSAADFRQFSMSIGRVPVAFSDALSAMPTWLAAYRTAYSKGMPHADAVFIADKEVSRAHGSSFIGDRPRVSRLPNSVGGEVLKTFTALYNFWNHSFNNQIQMAWDVASKMREKPAFEGQPSPPILDILKKGEDDEWYYRPEPNAAWTSLSKRLALMIATVIIEEMATAPLDDDHHGLLAKSSLAFIRYAGSGIVGLREATNGFARGYEPSTGMIGTMGRAAYQVGKDIKNMGAGQWAKSKDWMTHFATALGFMSGVGGVQYGRTATGVTGIVTGKDIPGNKYPAYRLRPELRQQLRTGHSKPRIH